MTSIREIPKYIEPVRYEYARVRFKECVVAGLSFHIEKDDEIWDELAVGTKVALVRDKKNAHDVNAVAVALADDVDDGAEDFDFNFILGYIPRSDNAELAALLDAGYSDKFEAEITHYQRFGKYEDRIRITIWLRSNNPTPVRPNCLRAQALTRLELRQLNDDLHTHGMAYFRWSSEEDLPIKGERVAFINVRHDCTTLYFMQIQEVSDEIPSCFDTAGEHYSDDGRTFTLSNIAGPLFVTQPPFDEEIIAELSVYNYIARDYSRILENILATQTDYFNSPNNIDADPSIDDPKDLLES